MPVTRIRHVALWLIVAAYMIAYVDRLVLSAAVPIIQSDLAIDAVAAGRVFSAFSWAYLLFQIPGGWLADRIGPRRALSLAVIWWSVFASATALAWNAASLTVFRFLVGVGQAGAFAIATRSLWHWMLPTERGWAQGVTRGGLWLTFFTPAFSQPYMASFGWRVTLFFFGVLGFAWAAVWFFWYRDTPAEHSWINKAERDLIQESLDIRPVTETKFPWSVIFSSRAVWTLSAMYGCCAWVISAYLSLLPTYYKDVRGGDPKTMFWDFSVSLAACAILGSLGGGWLSDRIGRRSNSLKLARQAVAIPGLLLAAASMIPTMLFPDSRAPLAAMSLGTFGLAMATCVSWAVPLDIGREYAGTVAAVMNSVGCIAAGISPVVLTYVAREVGWPQAIAVTAISCVAAAVLFTRIDASRPLEFPCKLDPFQTMERVFHEALARPREERHAFVEASCVRNRELVREIESLLWHHGQATTRFEGALGPVASDVLSATRGTNGIHNGAMLGPYRLDYKLGEGGMGAVYAATDTRLDRRVAVKIVNRVFAETPWVRTHFLREARSAAALAHANIAIVHDVGETDAVPWIVMEYIAGTSLRSKLQAGPMSGSSFLKYAVQLAAALGHAHSRRIIHRDIKAENIIITDEENLKVIDFGLARPLRDESSASTAHPRTFVGTIAYAAPELLSGGDASSRSDIYSAGLVMYEMAFGQHPFVGLTGPSLATAILASDHTVKSGNGGVTGDVAFVINRCLSREPAARYCNGAELADALLNITMLNANHDNDAELRGVA